LPPTFLGAAPWGRKHRLGRELTRACQIREKLFGFNSTGGFTRVTTSPSSDASQALADEFSAGTKCIRLFVSRMQIGVSSKERFGREEFEMARRLAILEPARDSELRLTPRSSKWRVNKRSHFKMPQSAD
jgi:hypothetical protein